MYPTTDRPYKYRTQRVLYYVPTQRVGTRIVAWERRKFADGNRLIPYAAPSTMPELTAGIGVDTLLRHKPKFAKIIKSYEFASTGNV